jgi:membrane glycosyltransferase
MSGKHIELTPEEIRAAENLIESAMQTRAIPYYSPDERLALAILTANYSQLQRARGRKSKSAAKQLAQYRRNHVNLLLRYVIDRKYRQDERTAKSLATVMAVVDWLDGIKIEASEPQVRRDIHAALRRGPLPKW